MIFSGHIHQSTGTGEVEIAIWDSIAAQDGEPTTWKVPVVQVTPTLSKNGAEVYLQSGTAVFRFNGDFANSLWIGTVERKDLSNGELTFIGNFSIASCRIFDCSDDSIP